MRVLILTLSFIVFIITNLSAQINISETITEEDLIAWQLDTVGCHGVRFRIFNKYFKARTEAENYLLKGLSLDLIIKNFGNPNNQVRNDEGELSEVRYILDDRKCGQSNIYARLDILIIEDKVKSHWLWIE